MTPQLDEYEYSHSVTSENTVPHWVIYAMDAIEADDPADNREQGCDAETVYDYASDEDNNSLVFRDEHEVRHALKTLHNDRKALDCRTDETTWHGHDVDRFYRLNETGRKALLDLGKPEYLPNRRDPEFDRGLPMEPNHTPGWWLGDDDTEDDEQFEVDAEWQLEDNDWIQDEEVASVYYKDEADALMADQRSYDAIAHELSEAFPEVTFVVTCGPYRTHDIMYRLRDPFNKVVQLDIYSPMALHRETSEITKSIEMAVKDLHQALETADEELHDDG